MTDVDRDFVLRQAGYLTAAGSDGDAARARLREALGEDHDALIGAVFERDLVQVRNPLFARFAAIAAELGLGAAAVAAAEQRLRHGVAAAATPTFRIFRGLAAYVATLAVLMVALLVLFTQVVIPVFAQMFESFGGDLPGPTALMLRADMQLLLVTLPVVLVVALWALGIVARRIMSLQRAMPMWLTRTPLLGGPLRRFALLLELTAFESLWRAGGGYAHLVEQLTRLGSGASARDRKRLHDCLAAAGRLDTLEHELAHWHGSLETELMLAMVRTRDVIALLVQVSMGLAIGYLVLAMYLPIFAFGQVL
jgi:type IV pilus assembly protein PilC